MDYPNIRTNAMDFDRIRARYPRLIRAMMWAALLTQTEAVSCIQSLQCRCGGSEAVQHYGGPVEVLAGAIRCRQWRREELKACYIRLHETALAEARQRGRSVTMLSNQYAVEAEKAAYAAA
jgi:uncharacterized protein (DUF433 family)